MTFHPYDLDALLVLVRIELALRFAQLWREKANATLCRLCLSFLLWCWSVARLALLSHFTHPQSYWRRCWRNSSPWRSKWMEWVVVPGCERLASLTYFALVTFSDHTRLFARKPLNAISLFVPFFSRTPCVALSQLARWILLVRPMQSINLC